MYIIFLEILFFHKKKLAKLNLTNLLKNKNLIKYNKIKNIILKSYNKSKLFAK